MTVTEADPLFPPKQVTFVPPHDNVEGVTLVIVKHLDELVPQLLPAVTHNEPEVKVLVKLTVTEVVP